MKPFETVRDLFVEKHAEEFAELSWTVNEELHALEGEVSKKQLLQTHENIGKLVAGMLRVQVKTEEDRLLRAEAVAFFTKTQREVADRYAKLCAA